MLTPEQVEEIREKDKRSKLDAANVIRYLLSDRAEIALELERIRGGISEWRLEATYRALTALIERIGK